MSGRQATTRRRAKLKEGEVGFTRNTLGAFGGRASEFEIPPQIEGERGRCGETMCDVPSFVPKSDKRNATRIYRRMKGPLTLDAAAAGVVIVAN